MLIMLCFFNGRCAFAISSAPRLNSKKRFHMCGIFIHHVWVNCLRQYILRRLQYSMLLFARIALCPSPPFLLISLALYFSRQYRILAQKTPNVLLKGFYYAGFYFFFFYCILFCFELSVVVVLLMSPRHFACIRWLVCLSTSCALICIASVMRSVSCRLWMEIRTSLSKHTHTRIPNRWQRLFW